MGIMARDEDVNILIDLEPHHTDAKRNDGGQELRHRNRFVACNPEKSSEHCSDGDLSLSRSFFGRLPRRWVGCGERSRRVSDRCTHTRVASRLSRKSPRTQWSSGDPGLRAAKRSECGAQTSTNGPLQVWPELQDHVSLIYDAYEARFLIAGACNA